MPYLGEIKMVAFSRVPDGWLACDGSLQSISSYEALFVLIGTSYGGDGQNTFGLPDLRGRAPVHQGSAQGRDFYPLGGMFGAETVTLTASHLPGHTHAVPASTTVATSASPVGAVPALLAADAGYADPGAAATTLAPGSVTTAPGGGQPHDNRPSSLAVLFIICVAGRFPSES